MSLLRTIGLIIALAAAPDEDGPSPTQTISDPHASDTTNAAAGTAPPRDHRVRRVRLGLGVGRYHTRSEALEGNLRGLSATAAVRVAPPLELEVEFTRPRGIASSQYSGISISFAGEGASREEIERLGVLTRFSTERRVGHALSFGAALQPGLPGRVRPRLYVGLTRHQVHDRTTREPLRLPPGATLVEVLRVQPEEQELERSIGTLTLGAGLMVGLTAQLSVVPDFRYDLGSWGDEINSAYRASLRLEWAF